MSEDRFLLVKGISGLGNRMECVLTAILYAHLTGRSLIVDWSDHYYSSDGYNVFHRFFQCSLCRPIDGIPNTDSVMPRIWRGHMHESAWSMRKLYGKRNDSGIWRKFSIELEKLDYEEEVLVMWTYEEQVDLLRSHFRETFQEFALASSDAILSKLLRDDLILHPNIRVRVDQFKDDHFRKKTVGVHVRYTDHRAKLWAILKKLNALLKREPDLQVFLSTDNIQVKKIFKNNYSAVIATPHWYPSPGLNIHQNKNRPDPIETGIEALVDLYLLAECNYLIIDTSSSFSYLAKLLTKSPDSSIFDVGRRGGKPSPPMRRLFTRFMIRTGLHSWGLDLMGKFLKIHNRCNL